MLINEVSKATNLTKKAIEYYVKQDLIFPGILENRYRDFNETDMESLGGISVLRKLGMSIEGNKSNTCGYDGGHDSKGFCAKRIEYAAGTG